MRSIVRGDRDQGTALPCLQAIEFVLEPIVVFQKMLSSNIRLHKSKWENLLRYSKQIYTCLIYLLKRVHGTEVPMKGFAVAAVAVKHQTGVDPEWQFKWSINRVRHQSDGGLHKELRHSEFELVVSEFSTLDNSWVLFSTLEPCCMCLGPCLKRLGGVFFLTCDPKFHGIVCTVGQAIENVAVGWEKHVGTDDNTGRGINWSRLYSATCAATTFWGTAIEQQGDVDLDKWVQCEAIRQAVTDYVQQHWPLN
eukprot:m.25452 g.25452  ORF g.25452 m.25452 type:complete len:251 (+) comp11371_c0_seq1:396-1148(+)